TRASRASPGARRCLKMSRNCFLGPCWRRPARDVTS
ncbi:hypothetical protein AK812_SmicGene47930, partial [Symbiodinium microadriaticum]